MTENAHSNTLAVVTTHQETYSWTEILTTKFKAPIFLDSRKLIPEHSLGMIVGGGNVGKSWVAYDLAIDVVLSKHRVLMLAAEDAGVNVQQRLMSLLQGNERARLMTAELHRHGFPLSHDEGILLDEMVKLGADRLLVRPGAFKLDTTDGRQKLETLVNEFDPTLIIVDPLSNFMSGSDKDDKDCKAALDPLIACVASGRSVLVVHHTLKNDDAKERGHTVIFDLMDMQHTLTPTSDKSVTKLACTKVRHFAQRDTDLKVTRAPSTYELYLEIEQYDTEGDLITQDGRPVFDTQTIPIDGLKLHYDEIARDTVSAVSWVDRILNFLRVNPEGCDQTHMLEQVLHAKSKPKKDKAWLCLKELETDGLIETRYGDKAKNGKAPLMIVPSAKLLQGASVEVVQ